MAEVTIDPRYSKHNNQEIERILDSVKTIDTELAEDSPNPIAGGAVAAALGNYPTKEQVSTALGDYYTKDQADELLDQKQPATKVMTAEEAEEMFDSVFYPQPEPDPEPEPEPEPESEP